jgi:hypothetical protein
MTGPETTSAGLAAADLPVGRHRDDAWRMLRARGGSTTIDGQVVLTSAATVETVLKQPTVFSSKKAFDALGSPLPLVPLAFDPPEQTRYRRILQPFFSPRSIRPLEEPLRAELGALLDPIAARGECDFVAEVAVPFPTMTFLTLFGLPAADRDRLIAWKDTVIGLSDSGGALRADVTQEELEQALGLFGYLNELVGTRRGTSGDDVLTRLLALDGDDRLTDEEVVGLCFLFVLAGLDTVTDALGMGMQRLAGDPDRRAELVADPGLIPAAVEELVRLDPPAPFLPRVTAEEVAIDGRLLPAGTKVSAHLQAANRDEAACPRPYEVDFHRPENSHASFGLGVHRCLGSHLARLEMRLVYEEWHRRIPEYRIAGGAEPEIVWPRGTLGLESLRLTLGDG